MREWLLGLSPVVVVAYFLLFPNHFAILLFDVARFLR
jgi:hypothetical protein